MQDPAGPALTSGPCAARICQLTDYTAAGLPFIHDLPRLDENIDWSAILNATRCHHALARPAAPTLGASVPTVGARTGGACAPPLEYATTAAQQFRSQPAQQLRYPQLPPSQPQVQPHLQPPRLQSGPDGSMQEPHQPTGASDLSPFTTTRQVLAAAAAAPGVARPTDVNRPCWPWYGTAWPPTSARTNPGPAREASVRQPPQSEPLQLQMAGAATGPAAASAGPATPAALVQVPAAAFGGTARGRGLHGRRECSNVGVGGFVGIDNWDIDDQLLSEIALTPWPAAPIQEINTSNMYSRASATWHGATAAPGSQDDGASFQLPRVPYIAAAGALQGRPPAQGPTAGTARLAPLGHLEINEARLSSQPPPPHPQRQRGCPLQSAARQPRETAAASMLPLEVLDQLPNKSASVPAMRTAASASTVGAFEGHLQSLRVQPQAIAIWSVSCCGVGDGFVQALPFPWRGASTCNAPTAGACGGAVLPPPVALSSFLSDACTSGRAMQPAAARVGTAAVAYTANSAGGSACGSGSGEDIRHAGAAAEAFEGGGAGDAGSKSAAVQGQDGEARDVPGAQGAEVRASALLAIAALGARGGNRGGPTLALFPGDAAASAAPSKPQRGKTGKVGSSSTRGGGIRGAGSSTSDVTGSDTGGSGAIAPDTREAFLALVRLTYDLPVAAAATALGVSVTELKRRCRAAGIQRWPSRKLQSLGRILSSTLEDKNLTEQQRQDILTAVAHNRRAIFEDPNAPLLSNLRIVRQAQYKQLHARRHNKVGGAGSGLGGNPRP